MAAGGSILQKQGFQVIHDRIFHTIVQTTNMFNDWLIKLLRNCDNDFNVAFSIT